MTNQQLMTKLQAAEDTICRVIASVHGVLYAGQAERRDALRAEAVKRGLGGWFLSRPVVRALGV